MAGTFLRISNALLSDGFRIPRVRNKYTYMAALHVPAILGNAEIVFFVHTKKA